MKWDKIANNTATNVNINNAVSFIIPDIKYDKADVKRKDEHIRHRGLFLKIYIMTPENE